MTIYHHHLLTRKRETERLQFITTISSSVFYFGERSKANQTKRNTHNKRERTFNKTNSFRVEFFTEPDSAKAKTKANLFGVPNRALRPKQASRNVCEQCADI